MRRAVTCLTLLLWCASAFAGSAALTWTAPTKNVDGSTLTNLAKYGVFRRCQTGAVAQIATVNAPTQAYTDANVPDDGRQCWYSLTAIDTNNVSSARTNEVTKVFALAKPGAVTSTFAWQIVAQPPTGPPSMGIVREQITGTSGSTSKQYTNAVKAGSLLVAVVRNGTASLVTGVSDDVNGAWTEGVNIQLSDEFFQDGFAIYYKRNSAAGQPTVTWTAASIGTSRFTIAEYSGVADEAPYASASSATGGSGNNEVVGPVTVSGETLAIAGGAIEADGGTMTGDGAWTLALKTDTKVAQWEILNPADGSLSFTMTVNNSDNRAAGVLLFNAAGGAAPASQSSMLMLGVGQ